MCKYKTNFLKLEKSQMRLLISLSMLIQCLGGIYMKFRSTKSMMFFFS